MREPRVDIEAMVRSLQSRIENPDYRYDSCDSAESGSDGEIEFGSSPRKVSHRAGGPFSLITESSRPPL